MIIMIIVMIMIMILIDIVTTLALMKVQQRSTLITVIQENMDKVK